MQSRYYNPEIGRFINADALASTGQGLLGNNMFAYCANNPVKYTDESGAFFFTAVGAITGFISGAIVSAIQGKSSQECLEDALAGAVGGAVAGAGVDIGLAIIGTCGMAAPVVIAAGAVAFTAGGMGNVLSTYITSDGTATAAEVNTAFLLGGIANVISFGTSFSAIGSSLSTVAVAGLNNFQNNFNMSLFIAYTTGAVTTIGQYAVSSAAFPWIEPTSVPECISSAALPWLDPNFNPLISG